MPAPGDEIQALANEAMQAALREAEVGQLQQADALYRAVLELQPGHPGAHFGLGSIELQAGRLLGSLPHFASALQGDPGEERYWLTYIDALMQARQFATARELIGLGRRHGLQGPAADAFEQQLATTGAPDTQEIDAAAALFAQGQDEAAGNAARALVERFPQHAFGWKLLGAVLYKNRLLAPAIEAMQKSVRYAPDDAETLSNLGLALKQAGVLAEAKTVLEQSIALRPRSSHAHNNLAATLQEMGRLAEAHASANTALALDPDNVDAWNTLAVVLGNLGRSCEAVAAYRRVLARSPNDTDAHGNMLFCMTHMESVTPDTLFDEHRRFGQRLEARLETRRAWDNTPEPRRRLRVGFVSGDLRNHAIANFVEPVFKRLAMQPGLALHAYYNYPLHDDVTARLRGTMAQWRDVAALDDDALDALVRADGIDILIDLSGHTGHNRLPVFARKPAPVQASWIGYPGTTGLAAMDYYLADRHVLPPGQFDHLFTEKLVHLPVAWAFEPAATAPDLAAPPALANGYLTFGSFNRISKISRNVASVWGKLLRSLPDARLVVAGMPVAGGGDEQLQAWLQEEGIDPGRLRFHPRAGMREYLALHNQVDICLDTFPYSGGTTTLHALYMGVPTLTLEGATMAGRQSRCLLAHYGLMEFIASDAEDFVSKGVAASRDLAALAQVRSALRGSYPLWTADGVDRIAASLDNALRLMWERWCAGLPAAAFEAPAAPGDA
ncbi:O-linked N-acetylglucosamine transferase, SPINDLY family protein [Telluria aromaticivorans]|uniref:protein O-GlcNAc transferase n=1 Tax=Telluria aromaticivorans TaxID=2725995 RepID=A0A7Y2JX13_9BURK|nr:tetratricopeptide repeat protein [Telluria aromaticivorans]NNG22582.1 tetratricopeptide repeat protein [Telluria aromaticivorans]